jgi:phenylacetate-CoA ligase
MTRAPFDWSDKIPIGDVPFALRSTAKLVEDLTRRLDRTQWEGAERIAQAQFAQLQPLAQHFAKTSPEFRARLEAAGLTAAALATPEGLRRLPLLTRRDLQQPLSIADDALPSGHGPSDALRTSGSTGEPVEVRRTQTNAMMWHALTMREMFWQKMPFAGRMSVIRATNPEYRTNQDWGLPVNLLFRTGPLQLIPITEPVDQQLARLATFNPAVLIVYPSVLEALATLSERAKVALPALELIWTVGEALPEHVREHAARVFGARIADNYSSNEAGTIALQCPDTGLYHTMDEALIVEVLRDDGTPCAAGETGRVVVTDLQNFSTPLIRYAIGDYAEVGAPCSCGRGLGTLTRVSGRTRNLIAMPDGTRNWPLLGFSKFREIAPIEQYQMVQETRDTIEVRLVVERDLTPDETVTLRETIQSALGYPFTLRFTFHDSALPRGANGKFEEFVSLV